MLSSCRFFQASGGESQCFKWAQTLSASFPRQWGFYVSVLLSRHCPLPFRDRLRWGYLLAFTYRFWFSAWLDVQFLTPGRTGSDLFWLPIKRSNLIDERVNSLQRSLDNLYSVTILWLNSSEIQNKVIAWLGWQTGSCSHSSSNRNSCFVPLPLTSATGNLNKYTACFILQPSGLQKWRFVDKVARMVLTFFLSVSVQLIFLLPRRWQEEFFN